jgi:gluconolactonase
MTTPTSALASQATNTIPSAFAVYNTSFLDIIGQSPKLDLLVENNDFPFAHEASVYIPTTDELFMSSNMFTDPATNEKTIKVSKVSLSKYPLTAEIVNTTVPMANGGINHDGGILWTAQGGLNDTGGLVQMSVTPPYKTEMLLNTFYGRQFNSLNDVAVHDDGSIWFTDPIYGSVQGIRPKPKLPSQVYRFDPATRDVRVVADGFGRPNGISFSPDQKIVYITDTAETIGDGSKDNSLPATM